MFGNTLSVIFVLSLIIRFSESNEPFFECTFKANDCGIINEPNMAAFVYGRASIGGRDQNMLVLDVSKAETKGARLITPYFHTYDKLYGCLTIDWFSNGSKQQSLSVTQQDKRNRKLWSSTSKSYDWQRNAINIDLRDGKPRFFIEANIEPKASGTIAIYNLRFDYNRC